MFLVLCLPVLADAADHRFALIIGNKDYRGVPLANSLNNPLESAESSRGLRIEPSGGTEDYQRLGLCDVQFLLSALPENGRSQTLILLDACRNNPFAHLSGERAVDIDSGLAPMRAPPGTLTLHFYRDRPWSGPTVRCRW